MTIEITTLSPEAAAQHTARLAEKKELTSRVSETSRYVAFGLLAIYYGLHTANDSFSAAVLGNSHTLINLMALYAVLAVISDYLQYYFGTISVDEALQAPDQLYDPKDHYYRARAFFYDSKQVLTLAAALLLLIAIIRNI